MKLELTNILCCPQTGQQLSVEGQLSSVVEEGWLVSEDKSRRYPVRNGIPRFVPESNYASNFGMQWNHFRTTQLDSCSGHPISADRFWKATNWNAEDLRDRWVLDAGCGAGRFAEVALKAGAKVVALDYSSSVDACLANLREHPNLHVVQGDIYALPFKPSKFAFVYSLGVLQHTPDVARAFASLPPMLEPGGHLCVDFYAKSWRELVHAKFWLRPLTTRVPQHRLFSILQASVPVLLPISRVVKLLPGAGPALSRLIPVVNYYGVFPLNRSQQLEWSLLDTFDWLAPVYDQPQTAETAYRWLKLANIQNIEVLKAGHLVARGQR